jgi:phosphoribosylformylglycinamidine synthase
MASKGGVGLDIDVDRVPLREAGMEPFEIMVSESQERMLCVVEPGRLEAVLDVCAKWEVRATPIGSVTATRRLRVLSGGALAGDMPVEALVDDCPLYDLEPERPAAPIYPAPTAQLSDHPTGPEAILALLRSPNVASKRWAFQQYDAIVGSRTVRRPETADAAVLALDRDGGHGALAVSIDCNGRRVACDPYVGTVESVLECARNLACVGAEPLGLTNCLNFGNPEKPHIAWQLSESVRGLGDACRALGVPVVGGNVSLYNEGTEGPIYPTPVVGIVGWLPDPSRAAGIGFAIEGHAVAVIGPYTPRLEGSELAKLLGEPLEPLAPIDIDAQRAAIELVRRGVRDGLVASAHDVSEGGLACALAECCIAGGIGARLELGWNGLAPTLFGEGPGGVIVSGTAEALAQLAAEAEAGDVPLHRVGETGGDALVIAAGAATLSLPVEDLKMAYEQAIPDLLT